MTAQDYILLSVDDVPFSTLDENTVFDLAMQRAEPFIATSALGELAARASPRAAVAAKAIIDAPWDHHLTAFAIEVLGDRDPGALLHADLSTLLEDPVILAAIMEVALSSADVFTEQHALLRDVATRVARYPAGSFENQSTLSTFMAKYGPVTARKPPAA